MSEGYLISSLIIVESRKFLIHWTGIELGKVAAPRALKVEFKMSKKKGRRIISKCPSKKIQELEKLGSIGNP